MEKNKLNLVIVDAIKTIIANTDNEVKYDVDSHIETKGYKQRAVRKVTSINIKITEQI